MLRLGDMSWPEVAEVLKKPHAILLTVSATEEGGYHLPLNFDTVMFTHMTEKAAEKVMREHPEMSIIVAPSIPYGEVSHVLDFPGSIGVEEETLIRMVSDILRCLVTQGFRNIIVVNGHFENVAAVEVACRKIHNEFRDRKDLGLFAVDPMYLGMQTEARAGVAGIGHALEAPTSAMLAIAPESVHLERAIKGKRKVHFLTKHVGETGGRKTSIVYKTRIRRWDETGIGGDPTMATREQGAKIIKTIVDSLADIIVQVVQSEGK